MSEPYIEDDRPAAQVDWALWRRIAEHARPYRRQLIGLAVSGFVLAGIDAATPLVTGRLIDEATARGVTTALWGWVAGYVTLVFALCICVWVFIVLAGQTATGVARDLRTAGFARLQALSFSYFDVRPVGWLVTRLTSDCSKLSSLMPWFMLDLVWGTSLVAGILAGMLWLSWPLALVVMLIVPPLAIVSQVFQRRLLESSRHVRRTNSEITAAFNEGLMGVRTTKTLVREQRNLAEFQVRSRSMEDYSIRNALQSAVYLPLVVTLGSAGVGLSLWRGGLMVGDGDSTLTLGTLVAFMQYAAFLYMPIQELARRFTELQSAQAAAERVQELLDTEPEIADAAHVRAAIDAADDSSVAIDGLDARIETIEFADVGFRYTGGERVLERFNLSVQAGETIALVGPTGGGKSTIVSLVSRFYEPTEGAILINGLDYRERALGWLQSNLGVVLQTPHLFSGTIRENIRYGRLDATDAEIAAAARAVGAHEFIVGMEGGYDADVGEGGGRVSTGQRQLLSLARALIADPQIFILDEATSSVDTETERLIQRGIETVLAGRIAFVIAHRLSTIRAADRIVFIERGRIVEQGPHGELLALGGKYAALVRHDRRD
ncbi:MAG: ABC transporter ATP-binding protein [Phycisphaerales bacterium]|nr:ABC transporter ATP-binding protein/permease [Phycisphaerae bacterium]NNM25196.1 ABC transporter ATP-binding protein [Phycisphaerales bacterium]